MSSPLDKKLDALEDQIAALQHKKKLMMAKAKQVERKRDTRRKVLLGALILEEMNKDTTRKFIRERLDKFLTRKGDHELFDDTWWYETFGDEMSSVNNDAQHATQ